MSKVTLALYEAGWVSLPPDHALFTLQAPLYLCRHPEHHFVVATQSYLDGYWRGLKLWKNRFVR